MDLRMKYRWLGCRSACARTSAEVAEGVRAVWPFGSVQVIQEAAHTLQAGGVEGFQNVERSEQECAGAAGRVQDRHVAEGVPEGAQQLRSLALGDDVLGELLDVQVQSDEVVDFPHLAGR